MLRNSSSKSLSALQKTYDESYLTCSTAVYYENQGDEDEALRCWKTALAQIEDHHTTKALPNYVPRTDAEKGLIDSIGELELQCKDRIGLLEALRLSREGDAGAARDGGGPTGGQARSSDEEESPSHEKGWIGGGTIPAITYTQLSRPALPQRPSYTSRTPSEQAAVGGSSRNTSLDLSRSTTAGSLGQSSTDEFSRKASRSPSPGKHVMRTTLRTGKPREKTSRDSRRAASKASEGPGASQAASLAWSALTSKEKLARLGVAELPASFASGLPTGSPSEHPRKQTAAPNMQWDSHTRRLVTSRDSGIPGGDNAGSSRTSDELTGNRPSLLSISAASSALNAVSANDVTGATVKASKTDRFSRNKTAPPAPVLPPRPSTVASPESSYLPASSPTAARSSSNVDVPIRRKPVHTSPEAGRGGSSTPSRLGLDHRGEGSTPRRKENRRGRANSTSSEDDNRTGSTRGSTRRPLAPAARKGKRPSERRGGGGGDSEGFSEEDGEQGGYYNDEDVTLEPEEEAMVDNSPVAMWRRKKAWVLRHLPPGVDASAARQILNEIVVQGDDVRWGDIAGLEPAKAALREAVVYPFLRPDLFMGLREPARGLLLFGPPGTGKTMLARAVATESRSTFFAISASSLTSKYLGESEKLVRALFGLARILAPSIIFVDEIDSLLSQRGGGSGGGGSGGGGGGGGGEHEASRRIKTEFLICWSDLQRAAVGRETPPSPSPAGDSNNNAATDSADGLGINVGGDPTRVLVLAATNLPWAIDEAARRRFVRRQYIPLPESETRRLHIRTLLAQQKHGLTDADLEWLVGRTEGFSGSDITALAKDAAMGPLRSLGEALLEASTDAIRPIEASDFEASLRTIRPSVSATGLRQYEDWAKEFGERGG